MIWTALALLAFAANSILCRLALRDGLIDPAEFTAIRLLSGAVVLWLIVNFRRPRRSSIGGSWLSAAAMVAYAVPFSFAYLKLSAGTGALILFFGVQATMIAGDILRGRRPKTRERLGLPIALAGLLYLLWPGVHAPEPLAAGLMALAGVSWGVYSLRGKGAVDIVAATAGNFMRGSAIVLPLLLISLPQVTMTIRGVLLAVASGAITSGLGYVVWYRALRTIDATQAAIAQVLVPLLTAVAGTIFLAEAFSTRLLISGTVIATGVTLALIPIRLPFQHDAK
jgi:drug/metabolite transporter (DMT)-like permease